MDIVRVLKRMETHEEGRDVEGYLDLAGCEGEARDRALSFAPRGYSATVGWYLASRQQAD